MLLEQSLSDAVAPQAQDLTVSRRQMAALDEVQRLGARPRLDKPRVRLDARAAAAGAGDAPALGAPDALVPLSPALLEPRATC